MELVDKTEFVDKELTCQDCGVEFTFNAGEQAFFWAKGFTEPKRCKSCRMLRKRSLASILNIEEGRDADKST